MFEALAALEEAVDVLSRHIGRPAFLDEKDRPRFRYLNPTSLHLQVLKAVRVVSGLNAAGRLIALGFVQEAGAVLRTVNDFLVEIEFMEEAHYGTPNEAQQQFLSNFFAEDVPTPEDMKEGKPKVEHVTRRKMRAAHVRSGQEWAGANPEFMRRDLESVAHVLDGYVHGNYPHIMELYTGTASGIGEHFKMQGMMGTPRIESFGKWFAMFVHPALNAVSGLLHGIKDKQRSDHLIDIRKRLETSTEYPRKTDPTAR